MPNPYPDIATRAQAALLGALSAWMLVGCEDTPRNILDPVGSSAEISATFFNWLMLLLSIIMFLVSAFFVYCLVRFRERKGDTTPPVQNFGNTTLEIGWTILPTIIVIAITIPTLQAIFEIEAEPQGESVEIEVIGKQWWWEYDYIHEGFTTANEMHVEVGTPVKLHVTSADVIHAWWVPRVSGKRDATPGRTYPTYFVPTQVGEFSGTCAELCGASHALMGIKLFVHPKEGSDSYKEWVKDQKANALPPTTAMAKRGKKLFIDKACVACHVIRGDPQTNLIPNQARLATTGPDLTHVGSRTSIAAVTLTNTRENLVKWIDDPLAVKEEAIMANPRFNANYDVTREEAEAIATYLFRLK
jgi:cytochrome c oxidase subunit 2